MLCWLWELFRVGWEGVFSSTACISGKGGIGNSALLTGSFGHKVNPWRALNLELFNVRHHHKNGKQPLNCGRWEPVIWQIWLFSNTMGNDLGKKKKEFLKQLVRNIFPPSGLYSDVLTGMRREANIHKLLNYIFILPKICPFWVHLEMVTQTWVDNDWTLNNIQARATETADETFFFFFYKQRGF